MKQTALLDFRGGYCTDVASELMANNELLQAQNCYWSSGLSMRKGVISWDKIWQTATSIVGGTRLYANSTWYNILAIDNGASVTFYHQTASTTATVIAGYNFTTGYNVEFANADIDGKLVFVNGQNKPGILYCTATWEIMDLEDYDERDRGTSTWWAGEYVEASASAWLTNTDNAQSTATASFWVAAESTCSSGFYLACTYNFNKIYVYDMGTVSATGARYEYYSGNNTWTLCSLSSSLPLIGTPPSATQLIEFNWASDWVLGDSYFSGYSDLENHYILRVTHASTSGSTLASYLTLHHSQYLTQVTDDDRAQAVATHNRFLHLAAGNNVYISDYGTPTGWEVGRAEYFLEGGIKVTSMLPFREYLLVFKENALYGLSGNAVDGWVRTRLANGTGCIAKRSPAVVKDTVFFVARDGIWIWNGTTVYKVSDHINTDFLTFSCTVAAGVEYNGKYWISFPSTTSGYTLQTDPDTFRTDEMGEGRVSWYKNTLGYTGFIKNTGAEDNGYLFGIWRKATSGTGANHLCQIEANTNSYDTINASNTMIDMIAQTDYRTYDFYGTKTRYGRLKYRISQTPGYSSQFCTLAVCSNNSSVTVSMTANIPSGTGYSLFTYTLPYTLDGENLSFYFRSVYWRPVKLAGISFEYEGRYF